MELREKVKILPKSFPNDLEPVLFEDELHHFSIHCQQKGMGNMPPVKILEYIRENGLEALFPNIDVAYRMLLCTVFPNIDIAYPMLATLHCSNEL